MKKLLIGLVALGVFFGVGWGLHATLIGVSQGSGAWAERASTTCSLCHHP